jgi:threonine/homoserine efflux transporter RhtA
MWDGYTVAMRRARLDGLHAAAIAAAVSFLLYLPVRAMMAGATLFKAPWFDVALQAGRRARSLDCDRRAIALWPHGRHSRYDQWRSLRGLDPSNAVLAIPVLLEWPSVTDWIAIALVSLGVYLVSGGRTTRSISDRSPKLQFSVAGVDKMNGLVA